MKSNKQDRFAEIKQDRFGLTNMSNFADDNFMIEWSLCRVELKTNMENKLKLVTKWLSDSGLKVNKAKTELCIFYKNDTNQIVLDLNGTEIKSSNTMNVLGVIFDSKLQWCSQVANSVRKANSALKEGIIT